MRYARRVDANLTDIVKAARKLGLRVYVRNDALADLDVQLGERHEIWECKDGKKSPSRRRYTKTQEELRAEGWHIRLVKSVEDVAQARNEMGRRNERPVIWASR